MNADTQRLAHRRHGDRRFTTHSAAVAGILGPILFGVICLSLTVLQYDFLRGLGWHPIAGSDVPWPSALALGPYGAVQVANFLSFGLLLIVFAVGLQRTISAGRRAAIGPMLLILAGIALVVCGFPTEPSISRSPQTLHGWLHLLGFVLLALALLPAPFCFWQHLRQDRRWPGQGRLALLTGVVALAAFLGEFALPQLGQVLFYVFLAVILLWLELLALDLRKLAGRSPAAQHHT
jgi:hypothetical protein